ncbi:MAG: hypothetical protein ACJ8G7_23560 [Rhizobacter sp.]
MSTLFLRAAALGLAALLVGAGVDARANSVGVGGAVHVGGGHHHHHHGHWGFGVGVGFGPWYPYGWYPGVVVVDPPVAYERRMIPDAVPSVSIPAPVFTPKNGQSAAQTEADRRQCDREAMAQPAAMAEAGIFHRVVLVCMENHGYTVR